MKKTCSNSYNFLKKWFRMGEKTADQPLGGPKQKVVPSPLASNLHIFSLTHILYVKVIYKAIGYNSQTIQLPSHLGLFILTNRHCRGQEILSVLRGRAHVDSLGKDIGVGQVLGGSQPHQHGEMAGEMFRPYLNYIKWTTRKLSCQKQTFHISRYSISISYIHNYPESLTHVFFMSFECFFGVNWASLTASVGLETPRKAP